MLGRSSGLTRRRTPAVRRNSGRRNSTMRAKRTP
jgi:hypothetical protein